MRELMAQAAVVKGEYPQVSKWSQQKILLRKAHNMPITRKAAKALISALTQAHALPFTIDVSFIDAERGFGGFDGAGNAVIGLPAAPLPKAYADPAPYLRMGIVLHEFAHVLKIYREDQERGYEYTDAHSKEFVNVLDELLLEVVP